MHADGFEKILDQFPTNLRPCQASMCKEIRGILFPLLTDGTLFTGTPADPPEKLYDPIIEAFEDTIDGIT